jgi:choline dehydrogenase-like flavoprotein
MGVDRNWDAAVLGAGMGGGAAAFELTSPGYDVLLIEKGLSEFPAATFPLLTRPAGEVVLATERLEHGMWPTQVRAIVDSWQSDIRPYPTAILSDETLCSTPPT